MNPRLVTSCLFFAAAVAAPAADQPQFGQAWSRNMVSAEVGLPVRIGPEEKSVLRWAVDIGTESHSTPVVAGGRVYVGTNNGAPRDPRHQGDRGVFMCFDEQDGHLLWQLLVPKRDEDKYHDWPNTGISSPATVEGDRVYLVDNRGEVLCLDAKGLADGNDGPFTDEAARRTPPGAEKKPLGAQDADILWRLDLTKEAGIWSHDSAHSSILVRGPLLYLNSGTGVDNTHKVIRTPDAPSLVVVEKASGRLVARDDLRIAPDIFHCTWSSVSMGPVGGKDRLFLAAGNGVVYGFDPLADVPPAGEVRRLKPVWTCDFDPSAPKDDIHTYLNNRIVGPSNVYGMPVFVDGSLYVAGGGDWFWGKNKCWLKRFDATGTGDVTATAETWQNAFGKHTMATPAVSHGRVYVTDSNRTVHCMDAATGSTVWTHELDGEIWASCLVADGKVWVGSRRGGFAVLADAAEKRVLHETKFETGMSATPVAANGTLLVSTMARLFAFRAPVAE